MALKTLVVIPTYNEAESLPGVIARLRAAAPAADILVVDDASPDGTGDWAAQAAQTEPALNVLHHGGKAGLGAAYLDGFDWGLKRGYQVLCEMDADGSHRPEQLPFLLDAVQRGAGLAIGSRWVKGGEVVDWPFSRRLLSRGGNLYVALMLGLGVRDATAGFRAWRSDLLERLDLANIEARGYAFQVDMTWRAVDAGARVVEVPISFVERQLGTSKMTGGIVAEAMRKVTSWGLRRRLARIRGRPPLGSGRDRR
jgi:dolichol-phosphate mannosyltransferase